MPGLAIDVEMSIEITPASAVAELREAGFALLPLPNVLGYVDGYFARKFESDYVDCVVVRGAEFVHAARVRNEFDADDPLLEPEVLWFEIGDLSEVITALRELCQPPIKPSDAAWPQAGGRHRHETPPSTWFDTGDDE